MYLVQGSEAIGIGYVWVNTFLQQLSDCMEERRGEERRGRGRGEERRGEEREREKLLCWWVCLVRHTSRCNT